MTKLLWITLLIVTFCHSIASSGEDDAERAAYLAKRAAETAAAEAAIKELTVREVASMKADDWIRLSRAYNEMGDNPAALEAVCQVSDEDLAKKKQLGLKAVCFQNVNFRSDHKNRTRELAFIDRCLDKKYEHEGVWLWRKAKVVCQASVESAVHTIGDNIGSDARVIDRQQYEYAFELLERAFQAEPKLYQLEGVGHEFTWGQDFPMLHEEARFKELMKKHSGK